MSKTAKITQQELADRLQVSRQAVSFALNGTGRLSDEVRQRILNSATEMGYRPNAAARAVKSGRFEQIGLVLDSSSRSILPSPLLDGLQDALDERGWGLVVTRWDRSALGQSSSLPKAMREMMVDGLLLNFHPESAEVSSPEPSTKEADAHVQGVPSIWLNNPRDFDVIRPDDFKAGKDLTQTLIQQGRKDIRYLCQDKTPGLSHYSMSSRREGYIAAMKEANLKPKVSLIADPDPIRRFAMLEEAVCSNGWADAIISYSPCMLLSVYSHLLPKHGLSPITDVSLASFADDTHRADLVPALMAVAPWEEIGKAAAAQLIDKILSAQSVQPPVLMPWQLHPCPQYPDSSHAN